MSTPRSVRYKQTVGKRVVFVICIFFVCFGSNSTRQSELEAGNGWTEIAKNKLQNPIQIAFLLFFSKTAHPSATRHRRRTFAMNVVVYLEKCETNSRRPFFPKQININGKACWCHLRIRTSATSVFVCVRVCVLPFDRVFDETTWGVNTQKKTFVYGKAIQIHDRVLVVSLKQMCTMFACTIFTKDAPVPSSGSLQRCLWKYMIWKVIVQTWP